MTSFNHYALGAVADWMHRTIAGLAPGDVGYRQMDIRPQPGAGLTYARASHITPYGLAESEWKAEDGQFTLNVIVPPNATAQVTLPGSESEPIEVGSGSWSWTVAYEVPAFPASYTLDDVIGDILAHAATKAAVFGTFARLEAPGFSYAILESERQLTLRQALDMLPGSDELIEAMTEAFASLNG